MMNQEKFFILNPMSDNIIDKLIESRQYELLFKDASDFQTPLLLVDEINRYSHIFQDFKKYDAGFKFLKENEFNLYIPLQKLLNNNLDIPLIAVGNNLEIKNQLELNIKYIKSEIFDNNSKGPSL